MFFADVDSVLRRLPGEVAALLKPAEAELRGLDIEGSARLREMRKIRDQLRGGDRATSEEYHPKQHGLNNEQQHYFRKVLARSHVNLCEPALDRLVNSIHSGRIQRRVSDSLPEIKGQIESRNHAGAMAKLCQNAFAYGTGYLVPSTVEGQIKYWLPNPLGTLLIVDPADVSERWALVELIGDAAGDNRAMRIVTQTLRGVLRRLGGEWQSDFEEHGIGFLPAVVAYGRDRRHEGNQYGGSLIGGVADASIRITNNEVNLELLRDRQTQALLVVTGEPSRTSTDDQASKGKYIQFPRDGGDAHYETPESRIEAVIELTKRFAADAAIASGLPLDTFLPELISGQDASATAARIRAFPLQQRMTRLVADWESVEEEAAVLVAAVALESAGSLAGETQEELRALVSPSCEITPSLPEAESETLSNWQQKVSNFFAPVRAAIDFYSQTLSASEKEQLEQYWMQKHMANGAGERPAPNLNGSISG